MRLLTLFCSLALIVTGCGGPRYVDYFPYHDDGTAKPKVAFLPVKAINDEDRDLADYFTTAIRWNAMDRGELFFYSNDLVQNQIDQNLQVIESKDPLKKAAIFRPADFVVEVEVLQNEEVPKDRSLKDCYVPFSSKNYRTARLVKLRLRVVDIRNQEPKIILYEVVERSHAIPEGGEFMKGSSTIYEKLADQVTERIEDVIWCSK